METFNEDKLVSYELDDQVIKTGFDNYGEASQYAANKSGTLVEVAFTDGNDNPRITNEAGLIAQRKSLFIDAGPDYQKKVLKKNTLRISVLKIQRIRSLFLKTASSIRCSP